MRRKVPEALEVDCGRPGYGGLGLGLGVVSPLVELHGGTVRVENPGPGLGSTFAFRIPARLDGEAPAEKGDGNLESTAAGLYAAAGVDGLSSLRLLVVEDEPDAGQHGAADRRAAGAFR